MRVAWVTHQQPSTEGAYNGDNLLPGKFAGGAERSNYNRIKGAPKGVEVTYIHPDHYRSSFDFDFRIIGATDLLSHEAKLEIAQTKYALALTHPQGPSEGNRALFESARVVIGLTPAHLQASVHNYETKHSGWVMTPVELDKIRIGNKQDFALHAARKDWWKGEDNARAWASAANIPLTVMQRETHETVLETMSRARYFVHLPKILDAEPSAVIEAVLSGCEIISNDNVGLRSVPNWDNPDALRRLQETAADDFWQMALN